MKFLAFTSILALGFAAQAQVGPAGCGLGNVIMQDQNQVFASTTNGTSGSQTFGITSGTSNCVDGGARQKLVSFVEANKETLNKEAARGEGQTLASLNNLLGCKNDISPAIKNHYKQIFSTNDSTEISDKIAIVKENNANYCGI